ncbi:signal recognition particle protein [Candidatus Woesearchaeota archaeon]|nr:signal recognition particle protein [Candidatus Woesearchaeota archaeon]
MVLDKLGSSLKDTLKKIAGSTFVDEKLVNELVKDIQRALLHSDVNVQLVFELSKRIKERALKEETPGSLTKKEHLVNTVYEELVKFLGEEAAGIEADKKPFKIMMVGLFGSGKTTTIGKLAKHFQKRGKKVCAIGLDVHRPAAPQQLKQVMSQINATAFIHEGEKDPVKIYKEFEKEIEEYDIVLVDTAGRDALSDDLIAEINKLNELIKPDEKLLVISADIGQAAQKQAEAFHDSCGVTGVIATKMDGTAKGGGALTACAATEAPIKFIGTGERIDDLEPFNPKGFVGRLLGMGDIEALLEKAKEAIPEEKAEDMSKKFLKGDFNLMDLLEQMKAMKKMGSLSKLMEMVPGMGQLKLPKDMLNVQEEKMKKWEYAANSMTQEELEDPDILSASRIDRIAKGSGVSSKDIRELIKQYRQSKKMVKMFKGKGTKNMEKMMKQFKGKLPGM